MEYKEGMTIKEYRQQNGRKSKGRYNADYSTKDYMEHYRHSVWRYQGGFTKRGTRRKRMQKSGKWTIRPALFRKIITSINSLLLETILQGEDVELPVDFGILYARQKKIFTKLDEEGNIKTNRAVNWNETVKLWFADKEAREAKQRVFHDNCTSKVYMRIQFGDFPNKRFLTFMPVHNLMRQVAKNHTTGNLELPPIGTSVKGIKDISYDREY